MMWQSGHDVTKKRPREGKTKKQKQKKTCADVFASQIQASSFTLY